MNLGRLKLENNNQKYDLLLKYKIINIIILIFLIITFIISNFFINNFFGKILKMFSGAAMVGALADWFAVVALFKHPLNIPLPHTAIIPKNKNNIGKSLGKFIETEFLNGETLSEKIKNFNLSLKISQWLSNNKNRKELINIIKKIIPDILNVFNNKEIVDIILMNFKKELKEIKISPIISNVLESVVSNNKHHRIIYIIIKELKSIIQKNKYYIREKIEEETPWWTFGLFDNKIYKKVIKGINDFIYDIQKNPENKFRNTIDNKINQLIDKLKKDNNLISKVEKYKSSIIENKELTEKITLMINNLSRKIIDNIKDENSEIIKFIDDSIKNFATSLQNNMVLRDNINKLINDTAINLISENSDKICSIIPEKIQEWDEKDVTRKLELQIGKELQYIRINGALIGGFIGIFLFLIETIL